MEKTVERRQTIETPADQKRYAFILKWATRVGLFLILFTFAIYLSGLISPVVPIDRLPKLWSKSSALLNGSFGIATGWGWINLILRSDMMAKASLTFLAVVPILCYVCVLPIYLRKKEFIMVVIVLAEIFILAMAASGLLRVGE